MTDKSLNQKINDIVNFISNKLTEKPQIGMILGSGLGNIVDSIKDKIILPYSDIPHLPQINAPGHAGNLILGQISKKPFIIMQGRFHLYEGHSPQAATLLVRAMKKLGVDKLIITCAAGGMNIRFQAGEIMVITDHINFTGTNPLIGLNLDEFGPRFPNMFDIYTKKLQKIVQKVAVDHQIRLCKGVYAGYLGPTYSTRAELAFYLGSKCDAVGMSVVQEAIVAAHCNMQILGLAAITDIALPNVIKHATEAEVIATGKKTAATFKKLIKEIAKQL